MDPEYRSEIALSLSYGLYYRYKVLVDAIKNRVSAGIVRQGKL